MKPPITRRVAKIAAAVLVAAAAVLAWAAAFIYSGLYDISATDEHTPPVYWLLELTMRRSVHLRANRSLVPELTGSDTIENGFRHYQARCVQCHGAPGISPDGAALGMRPLPGYLVPTAREWSAAEIYWVVKHGIKMTGMPAWKYRLSDEEIWQVVAFVHRRLPYVTAEEYREMAQRLTVAKTEQRPAPEAVGPGDAQEGRRALQQYACATCHVIPGITGANKTVGPPLTGIASRTYIAGVLPNTPENMMRWIMSPQTVSALTAMPNLGVSETDARGIAAYLATLKAK